MKRGERNPINLPAVILSILGVFVLASGIYVYFALNGTDYTSTYSQRISDGTIIDPIKEFQMSKGTSSENKSLSDIIHLEGISGIDLGNLETKSINYMSVKLYLYNLHNIPLTHDNPRIQAYIDSTKYSIEIEDGEIYVKEGIAENPDVIIRTTLDEVSKIIENPEYAKGSLNSGKTSIEITGSKITLFLKGYSKLYSMIA